MPDRRFRPPGRTATVLSAVMLLLTISAAESRAADLKVKKALWKNRAGVLYVSGKGEAGQAFTLRDADTGDPLAQGAVGRRGRWKVKIALDDDGAVPCRIAVASGDAAAEKAVSGSPCEVSVDSAAWKKRKRLLRAKGKGYPGAELTVYDAQRGTLIGTVKVNQKGKWAVRVALDREVPCRLRVSGDRGAAERDVRKAPDCDADLAGRPKVTGLAIAGPAAVDENSSRRYQAWLQMSDDSRRDVSDAVSWKENSPFAEVDADGTLTAFEVDREERVKLSVVYREGKVSRKAALTVTIRDAGASGGGSHAGRFSTYEGSRTCMPCHGRQVREVHASVHYQWKAAAPDVVGANGKKLGKLGSINDFCTYPDINWIGQMTNTRGKVVDGGCAKCHVGMGDRPESQATTAQLENIDCLVCHSDGYRRKVENVNGDWRFVPDETAMPGGLLQAAQDIGAPSTAACLRCHGFSGGGNNFKRGDLESGHADPARRLDVHMAAVSRGGAGMTCLDCHRTEKHRIAGRGTDLRPRESSDRVSCRDCHGRKPHGEKKIDRHTARVNCTVCHIPAYARGAPTDLHRDWSRPAELVAAKGLYEPHMTMKSSVTPVYRFFNGTSRFYRFGEKAIAQANGRVLMAGPQGSVGEAGAMLYAFKHHRATQPAEAASGRILPLKMRHIFQDGDIVRAAEEGAAAVGWNFAGLTYVETERYLGLFHQVAPRDQALACGSCHDGGKRLDFKALGYTPRARRNGRALCMSCHEDESDEWKPAAFFRKVHEQHVDEEKFDCRECHTFSAAG